MNILGIDTSCDETSVAVSRDDDVLVNVISSQVELHKQWGGVVPMIAKRAHEEHIDAVLQQALKRVRMQMKDVDAFAVTQGPGLAIALEVGIRKAKDLAATHNKPLVAVNHMEGHIYSCFTKKPSTKNQLPTLPLVALLVSGGHTELVFMPEHGQYRLLGETLDDAAGEAFDKVARMLGLGYPGGAVLAKMAELGDASAFPFPVPLVAKKDCNFSFSGIKAAMLRLVKSLTDEGNKTLTKKQIEDLAASFQYVVVKHLVQRTLRAIEQTRVHTILLGGGVSANLVLRKELRKVLRPLGVTLHYPKDKKLCMDNAAMIAVAGWYKARRGEFVEDVKKLDRDPAMRLSPLSV